MTAPPATTPRGSRSARRGRPERDEGAVLPLVLVMSVIGALVMLPLMSYAMAISRSNGVLSDATRNMEAVRAGARIALADPIELFERCDTPSPTPLDMPQLELPVTTTCRQVAEVGVIDEAEVPFGAVAIQVGERVPDTARGTTLAPPDGAAPGWWQAFARTDPTRDALWTPDLPERVTSLPDPGGYQMPASFGTCTVFFPGTYEQPLVLGGTAYFASGDYTFLDSVTVVGGADVVVGFGIEPGCADDIQSVLDLAGTPPAQYNISGGGATWVLAGDARLVIDNRLRADGNGALVANAEELPLRFAINQRYVDDPADPNGRLSIATVNGDADTDPDRPGTPGPLVVPGVVEVPMSTVSTASGRVGAIEHGYVPSIHTPQPHPTTDPEPIDPEPIDTADTADSRRVDASTLDTKTAETEPTPAVPLPVVDVDLSGPARATVEIAGYVATPQGRIRIANAGGHTVALRGGVVAGSFDVTEASPTTTVGFVDVVLQRTIVLRSTSAGTAVSTMTVQVNESGAYAVNSWVIQ
jgi:hypothetical protein